MTLDTNTAVLDAPGDATEGHSDNAQDILESASAIPRIDVPSLSDEDRREIAAADKSVADFSALWRRYEAARRRQRDGRPRAGDSIAFSSVGQEMAPLEDQLQTEFRRLTKIDSLMAAAGSLNQIKKATGDCEAATRVLVDAKTRCSNEIAKLEAKIAKFRSDLQALQDDHDEKQEALTRMTQARERLQSLDLLPPFIGQDYAIRRRSIAAGVADARKRLEDQLTELTNDSQRQIDFENGDVINEGLHRSFAESIKADPGRAGHEFWRDRTFSITEFGRFKQWARRRCEAISAQLNSIDSQIASNLEQSGGPLLQFYTSIIDARG